MPWKCLKKCFKIPNYNKKQKRIGSYSVDRIDTPYLDKLLHTSWMKQVRQNLSCIRVLSPRSSFGCSRCSFVLCRCRRLCIFCPPSQTASKSPSCHEKVEVYHCQRMAWRKQVPFWAHTINSAYVQPAGIALNSQS